MEQLILCEKDYCFYYINGICKCAKVKLIITHGSDNLECKSFTDKDFKK
jgi:hypothetical protein